MENRLHPRGQVSRGHVPYLIATAWDYEDIRLYAMHRMVGAQIADEQVRRPADFDIDAYIARGALHFGGEQMIELRLQINDYLARVLSETPLSQEQQIAGKVLTATVRDTWQLRWWILSQGAGVEVLGPEELRRGIARELQQAAARYAVTTSRTEEGKTNE